MDCNDRTLTKSLLIFLLISSLNFKLITPVLGEMHTSCSSKATQLYNQAARHYIKQEYSQAIVLLKQALKKDKKFVSAYVQLATIYRQLDQTDLSIQILDKANGCLAANNSADLCYEVAQLYYRLGCYKKAQAIIQDMESVQSLSAWIASRIQILKQNVRFALEKTEHPLSIHPQKLPLPLNQFVAQYFPILTVDQESLIFTACTLEKGRYRENLYISHRDKAGNWSIPLPISDHINAPTSNEGTCTISADKKTLIFTSCSRAGNYGTCDLYISYQKGDIWSIPKNLGPQINSHGWQSQPSLAPDGKTLYFVSERPGNYGKKDIWQSSLQEDGQWSQAINLGEPINSSSQEISPCIHPNGQTLFFASDRTPSLGGFDIYYSNLIDGQWTQPTHLGYPINNHKDQVSLFITADGQKAYYADGKHQGNHYYNSYLYEVTLPPHLVCMPKSDFVKLKILDESTQHTISAQVEVYEVTADNYQSKLKTEALDGETIVVVNEGNEYIIYISKDGYLFESIYVNYQGQSKAVMIPQGTIQLKALGVDTCKILQNIYFDFDDYSLENRSTIELKNLVNFLHANPLIRIEIEGHTDDIGLESYNGSLSLKRAKSIYDYLISAGIAPIRLSYQGYGTQHSLVPNDTPENRQRNRRVAFRITYIPTKP